MKKLFFVLVTVFAFGFANAQEGEPKIGVNLGFPVGDASDFTSISFGADIAYLWSVAPQFKAGLTAGYLNYTGKKEHGEKRDNLGFIPIAATAQYSLAPEFFVGADLGYALGVSPSESKGGFYYLPKVGYQTNLFEAYVGYKGISNKFKASGNIGGTDFSISKNQNMGAIVVGFNYKLGV